MALLIPPEESKEKEIERHELLQFEIDLENILAKPLSRLLEFYGKPCGDYIQNKIMGMREPQIIEYAYDNKWIEKKEAHGIIYWSVVKEKMYELLDFKKKYSALQDLKRKRKYAQEQEEIKPELIPF